MSGVPSPEILIKSQESEFLHFAAAFTIARTWKQPECPSVDEQIKKLRYIYTMKYYLAIKKKEILPLGTAWMDMKSIMLSKISQSDEDKYHMISLICGI